MGKIVFNVTSKKYLFLENSEMKGNGDIELQDMVKKIVLASLNNVKFFDTIDVFKRNKKEIQILLQNGYKPINEDMQLFLTQNYNMCPSCGKDIDIHAKGECSIYDVGSSLGNIVKKNFYPCKEIRCSCGCKGLYYFNIYAAREEREAFAKQMALDGDRIFIRYRYRFDNETGAEIPIIFGLKKFTYFFNAKKKRERLDEFNMSPVDEQDILFSLEKENNNELISLIFNKEFNLKISKGKKDRIVPYAIKSVKLGNYAKYSTEEDFEKICKYISIKDKEDFLSKF